MKKNCAQVLRKPLETTVNLSLRSCTFPETWKRSRICPILKSHDNTDITNYMPISVLSWFPKVFELSIYKIAFMNLLSKPRVKTNTALWRIGHQRITSLNFLMLRQVWIFTIFTGRLCVPNLVGHLIMLITPFFLRKLRTYQPYFILSLLLVSVTIGL